MQKKLDIAWEKWQQVYNVKQLKEFIKDLPDETPILQQHHDWRYETTDIRLTIDEATLCYKMGASHEWWPGNKEKIEKERDTRYMKFNYSGPAIFIKNLSSD